MGRVEEVERSGVAALTIEDTALPAGFGAAEKARLLPIEEGVGKMRAALAARQDKLLAIVGRTSAVSVTGVDDAIARATAYAAARGDALFFVVLKTPPALEALCVPVKPPSLLR